MSPQTATTEDKILNAAKIEFYQNGFKGARMQQIADTAGINKSLLHYYFRNKKRLYHSVLEDSLKSILPELIEILNQDAPIYDKVESFIEVYLQRMKDYPEFANFLLTEVNQDPQLIREYLFEGKEQCLNPFYNQFQEEITSGSVYFMSPQHFVVNLFALCTYPLAAKPFVQELLELDESGYDNFTQKRKKELTRFIFNALKPSAHK